MMLKSLQGRLSLLFTAFVLLVLISVGATVWGVETQRQDALVINLAGRQRMLTQQMTRLVEEWNASRAGDDLSALREAESTFGLTLSALREGGEVPYFPGQVVSLTPTRDAELLEKVNDLNAHWLEFHALLEAFIAAHSSEALQRVQEESTDLVQHADEVVRAYQSASETKMARLRTIQIGFFICALILLGVGVWVTRQSALQPLRRLARAAKRLGENDLETAIQPEGPEEMRALSESFDSMRKSLRASRSELLELMSTLEERVAQRTRELDALNEVSREIASQLDVRVVLNSVTEKARMLLSSDSAMLCLLGERKQRLHLQALSGLSVMDINREYMSTVNQASDVLTSQRALICNNAQCVGGCDLLTETHAASHAVAPLRIGEKVIGALCVSSSTPNHFTNESAGLLTKLANTAAIALQNAQLYAQAERVAILEERHRVAAEMHDGLGQTLSYLGLMTDQATDFLSNGQEKTALERLQKTRETIEKATCEVRRAINNLMDESSSAFDLCARLKNIVNAFEEETRLPVAWQAKSSLSCSRQVAEQALNVTSEALKNAARHAKAKHITMQLGQAEDHYFIAVEDDGKGFDTSQPEPYGHFGLRVMRARAAHIGGQVEIESAPERGTRVVLTWPMGAKE